MGISDHIKQNEKTYFGSPSVKYYFKKTAFESEYLLVIFSGFNGQESKGATASYNYIKALLNVEVDQLYILDSNKDNIPLYYLGEGNNKYEEKVLQLVLEIAKNNNVNLKNIITLGTSKGGTAAAYFAMKYGFGHFISGGMQTKVGDYLYSCGGFVKEKILTTISGNLNPEESVHYANDKMMEIFNNPRSNTNYHLHGGKNEPHFNKYMKPFIENLKKNKIEFKLDIGNYAEHGEVGRYFVPYLQKELSTILNRPIFVDVKVNIDNRSLKVITELFNDKNTYKAIYLFKEDSKEPIQKLMYRLNSEFIFENLEKGKYRMSVFIKHNGNIYRYAKGYYKVN